MRELLTKILDKIKKEPECNQAYDDLYYMCNEEMNIDSSIAVKYLKVLSDSI